MHAWEAIQKSIDYIETNIKEELTITNLANTASLSVYYYQRLFSRLVGKSVNEYIKARRVAHTKKELKTTDKRILDIALEYGFNSHETFTRCFKEIYGITPESYRKKDIQLTDFLKPNLMIHYTLIDENVPLLVDDMIIEIRSEHIKAEEYYTGLSKVVEALAMNEVGENTLVTLWTKFNQIKINIPNLKEDGVAIDYFTYASEAGKVEYFVGGESIKQDLTAYHQITLSQGHYYVCTFEAENFEYLVTDALYKANRYFFDIWLKNKGINMKDMAPFLIQKYLNVKDNPKIEIWVKVMN